MIEPTVALALVAITISVVVLFAVAELRREVVRLDAYVRGGIGGKVAEHDGIADQLLVSSVNVVLKVDPVCVSCHDVIAAFLDASSRHPDLAFVVLTPGHGNLAAAAASEGVGVGGHAAVHLRDDELFASLRTAWIPAVLLVDGSRTVVDALPAVDADSVQMITASGRRLRASLPVEEVRHGPT